MRLVSKQTDELLARCMVPSHIVIINLVTNKDGGPDSSVGIATRYWLDGPAIEFRLVGEIFRARPDRLRGPPSLLYNGYRGFTGGKAAEVWC